MKSEAVGTRIDRYEIEAVLGSGASTVTYRARDAVLDRYVALKVASSGADDASTAHLRKEVEAAAGLQHPNLISILDFGERDHRIYVVMELANGGSVRQRLTVHGPLSTREAVRIALDVCAGLSCLHGAGLVHRDLKPSNVLLRDDGTAAIADFGLVVPRGAETLTAVGLVFGTPAYMSPEQAMGERVDARSDLYQLGVLLYEMLTGHVPFAAPASSTAAILHAVVNQPPPPLRVHGEATPEALTSIVRQLLAKQPRDRYDSARSLAAALRALEPRRTTPSPAPGAAPVRVPSSTGTVIADPIPVADPVTNAVAPVRSPPRRPQLSPGAEAWIVFAAGDRAGERLPLTSSVVIGRAADADVRLVSSVLSRRHALLERRADGYYVVDLGSQNGVYVNGQRVTEARLHDRDQITLASNVVLGFVEPIPAETLVADAKRRLDALVSRWNALEQAAAAGSTAAFAAACELVAKGPLREALGYRVELQVPYFRGIVGFVVDSPMMWIRHSRFPILFVAYDAARRDVLSDVIKQIELAKVASYFALLVVVSGSRDATALRTLRATLADSVYRYDFVVLDRTDLASIVEHGTTRRLIEIVLDQGIDIATLSPYVVRGPVPEPMFFGREREVKAISQTIASRDYAVVGGRRIGKSSMLLKLNRVLRYDSRFAPFYMNCEDKMEWPEFFEAFAEALELPQVPVDVPALRRALAEHARATSRQLVGLLDEVDGLLAEDARAQPSGAVLRTLRALSHEGTCRFVLSGSRTLHAMLHDAQSPLFNFCEEMRLDMLDARSVTEIVTRPLQQLGFTMPDLEGLVARLARITGGHPNLVQWICDRLVRGSESRTIDTAAIERAAGDFAFRDHFIETAWGDTTAFERLVSLVPEEEEFDLPTVSRALRTLGVDVTRLPEALATLELFALVERNGEHGRFVLPEFPRMVRRGGDHATRLAALAAEVRA